jgi:hypothetical protein
VLIHPELRALWGDDAPQRVAQLALIGRLDDWRAESRMSALLANLDEFSGGKPLAACPLLSALFEQDDPAASRFARDFTRMCVEVLDDYPLGHVPFKHFTDGVHSTLLLERNGNVTLSLIAVDGEGFASRPAPVTADFSPSEVWEHVLAGEARADLIELRDEAGGEGALEKRDLALREGMVVRRRAGRQTIQLREVSGCLVTLRLQYRKLDAGPTREYRLADGEFVHQAAGNPRDSWIEMLVALAGRMGRHDAASLLADIALEQGSRALRWQALRECLALDTIAGFTALCAIARSDEDELAPAAVALRSQLIEAHPQLAEIEPCHE